MEDNLDFNDDELFEFMKEAKVNNIERCIDSLISFTRSKQMEYEHKGGNISGYEILSQFHQEGLIKTETYLKLRQLVDNPDIDYIINVK